MPLTKRIIPCLDVTEGRVVKGTKFINLKDAGDAIELGLFYDDQGADELVFLDITASSDKRKILIDLVEKTGENVFIPFTVGGGLRTIHDIKEILRAGADKVSLNTAAVQNPDLIKEGSKIFGSQCIMTAIDAKRIYVNTPEDAKQNVVIPIDDKYCWWEVYIHGGRTPTGKDAILWGEETTSLGSGEILLTSMDCDGTKSGYDLELTNVFSKRLDVPIIASGGAGNPQHIIDAFKLGNADAALAASIFHYNEYPIKIVKQECKKAGIPMRL
jgi:cyclase